MNNLSMEQSKNFYKPSNSAERATPNQGIGKCLKALREGTGLSTYQLAHYCGVHHLTVFAWEKGESKPLPEQLSNLAVLYETSIENILMGMECLEGLEPGREHRAEFQINLKPGGVAELQINKNAQVIRLDKSDMLELGQFLAEADV
ncbi:helix-turn-helix transcriptional regulator [Kistimonas asteriae]|uniref:helix-turn-helix transcriptional regulator n=1 Tax=Kistimonas asteriae TaxID=517724 RepID=UPI001BAB330C|nr:helix-turn-helix transcriptional regulator [Kistimonas asteriae]